MDIGCGDGGGSVWGWGRCPVCAHSSHLVVRLVTGHGTGVRCEPRSFPEPTSSHKSVNSYTYRPIGLSTHFIRIATEQCFAVRLDVRTYRRRFDSQMRVPGSAGHTHSKTILPYAKHNAIGIIMCLRKDTRRLHEI